MVVKKFIFQNKATSPFGMNENVALTGQSKATLYGAAGLETQQIPAKVSSDT